MQNVAVISAHNAFRGLYLTPEMLYYATDCITTFLERDAKAIHNTQVTTNSYARYADLVTDLYPRSKGGLIDQLTTCAALVLTHHTLHEWAHSAIQVAVNIHLNTLGVADRSRFPRVVPHQLATMRITDPTQIDAALLWRILVTEPWITYAERSRAQLARMATVLGPNGKIDGIADEILARVAMYPAAKTEKADLIKRVKATKRSIKRGYQLHMRLFGPDNLRQLLERKHLKLSGQIYDYWLTIGPYDLVDYTQERNSYTSPIHIKVLRKDDAETLCTLCLYFEDAPFIDHLVGITCHLTNRETEMELLRAAQVQNATRLFYSDPLLPALKGLHDPVIAPMSFIENVVLNAQYDVDNIPLRDQFYHFKWSGLARELIGYPQELLDIFWRASHTTLSDLIDNTHEAAPIMASAKEFFRTRFANTG